eukprot:3186848-Rhodomonas_salina.1
MATRTTSTAGRPSRGQNKELTPEELAHEPAPDLYCPPSLPIPRPSLPMLFPLSNLDPFFLPLAILFACAEAISSHAPRPFQANARQCWAATPEIYSLLSVAALLSSRPARKEEGGFRVCLTRGPVLLIEQKRATRNPRPGEAHVGTRPCSGGCEQLVANA